MILSTGRRYLFIHIPKTGGTALALALEERAMKDDILLGDTPKALRRRGRVAQGAARGRLWKHSTRADVEGLVPPKVLDDLFAFTLVRNPWDRAVSYYHWLRPQTFDHPAVTLARSVDFRSFVTAPQSIAAFQANPVASYMRSSDGKDRPALFIRIEHFEEDATPLVDHLGFPLVLPKVNTSDRHGDYRRYYDTATAEAVAFACTEDIERFGYTFD